MGMKYSMSKTEHRYKLLFSFTSNELLEHSCLDQMSSPPPQAKVGDLRSWIQSHNNVSCVFSNQNNNK